MMSSKIEPEEQITIKLNNNDEWNLNARELMARVRTSEDLMVEAERIVMQLIITVESLRDSISEIKKKKPTFEIVNKSEEKETED